MSFDWHNELDHFLSTLHIFVEILENMTSLIDIVIKYTKKFRLTFKNKNIVPEKKTPKLTDKSKLYM